MKKYVLSVDLGGTRIKLALVDLSGRVFSRTCLSTRSYVSNPLRLITAILNSCRALLQNNKLSINELYGLGIGVPGPVDFKNGVISFLPNIPHWKKVPLKAIIQKRFKIPVFLDNDVNLIALAEGKFGAGQGCRDMLCITLGTGVGGGIILDGKVFRGFSFAAGEVGHIPINEKGPRCNCGGTACLETYVGNRSLIKKARQIFKERAITLEEVSRLALKKKDRRAIKFWQEVGEKIGIALCAAVNLINPQRIVIGGGVANAGRYVFAAIRQTLKKRAMAAASQKVKVVKAKLGDDAGPVGAMLLVKQGLGLLFILVSLCLPIFSFAAVTPDRKPIEVNGDRVEFFADNKKVVAEGNVVINYADSRLTCNKIEVFTETKDSFAEGNVHLYSPKGEIYGERMQYNFEKQEGMLYDAHLIAVPFYGAAKTIERLGPQEMKANQSFVTTCDLEKPHYRLLSKQIQIYPSSKIVARGVTMRIGNTPIFYLPKYVHLLDDKRPRVTVIPGYEKNWGAYILTSWRYYFNENAKGSVHVDYREKKDLAWGIDYSYKTPNTGEGLIRTYYMNERSIQSKRAWVTPRDSIERERFKGEWRHKWQIDRETMAIWQYYKLSDKDFLKDYYKREYEKIPEPSSFFLLTKTLPSATLSLDVEKRVNRFFADVEMLPQLKLDTIDQRLGETRFYFKSNTSYATLAKKIAQPVDGDDLKGKQTERLDTYDQLSYQHKLGFIEARPYVAMRQTYFSRDISSTRSFFRGIFYSGIDLSTKFYRLFDVETDFADLDIHKLRHIITPAIKYSYIHPPTVSPTKLIQFDEIDAIDRKDTLTFELENKLQTKRGGSSVDLLRFLITTDYLLKYKPEQGKFRFDHVEADLEIHPYSWLNFYADSDYDTNIKKFSTANFDLAANGGDKWYIGLGQRYERAVSNQTTAEFAYRFNPKWKLRVYQRFEAETNTLKEQEYSLYRDLHCWTMEITFNTTRGEGNTIWIIFRIKAFPETGFEINNSYHQRKAGSQSSETTP